MNQQLALTIQLNHEATLLDFCWDGNFLLKQQISTFLLKKGEQIMLIWGVRGSGKSHLLQACCQALPTEQSSIYLPLLFLKEWGPESLEGVEAHDFIAIDDIDAIAGDSIWEEALFHLYNKARANETTLLIGSKSSPHNIPLQLADLHSRLNWGLSIQLHELNDASKLKTLQHSAQKRGFELAVPVGQFLISRCARNMHDLHIILDKLDKASLAAQRKLTIPFVKSVLRI